MALVFSACSSPGKPIDKPEPGATYTYSKGPKLDPETTATLLKADRIIHTFSNKAKLALFVAGDHVFADGAEIALTRRSDLPAFIEEYERNIASSKSIKPQGVGVPPGGTNADGSTKLWPSAINQGIIYYDVGGFSPAVTTLIQETINDWNNTSVAVKWRPRDPNNSTYKYATVSNYGILAPVVNGLGCVGLSSNIGYDGVGNFPVAGTIYLGSDCLSNYTSSNPAYVKTVVQHEMGHIVGLAHEQQYCGRNNFLSISNPQPSDLIYRYNFLELCGASDVRNYNVFDLKSIMLYADGPYQSQNLDPRTNFRYTVTMSKVTPPKAHYCGDPDVFGSNYATSPIRGLSASDVATINEMYV